MALTLLIPAATHRDELLSRRSRETRYAPANHSASLRKSSCPAILDCFPISLKGILFAVIIRTLSELDK